MTLTTGSSELARRYHGRNRKRGKLGGVERLRVRYRQYATPWYDVLFASRGELTQLAAGTGWWIARFIDNDPGYVAVLERRAGRRHLPAKQISSLGLPDGQLEVTTPASLSSTIRSGRRAADDAHPGEADRARGTPSRAGPSSEVRRSCFVQPPSSAQHC